MPVVTCAGWHDISVDVVSASNSYHGSYTRTIRAHRSSASSFGQPHVRHRNPKLYLAFDQSLKCCGVALSRQMIELNAAGLAADPYTTPLPTLADVVFCHT